MRTKEQQLKFPLAIITVVLGWTIYKQFDFNTLSFKKPWMAIIYILTFLMTVYLLFKKNK